jgi:NAD(P)-dependent dehydrogenase (short-subunit alcohol dehydrogenase family)
VSQAARLSVPDLRGRTALVTGASSGIGRCTAQRLAEQGVRTLLVGRSAAALATLAEQLPGGPHRPVVIDLVNPASIRDRFEAGCADVEQIDALVLAAGVFLVKPFAEIEAQELNALFTVNVAAPFLLAQAAVSRMGRGSAIVFVSSISARAGMAGQAAYSVSKAALEGLTRTLAVELSPDGIRVNAVAPGFIATPINESLRRDPARVREREQAILVGRLGKPEEIADAIVYLVSQASSFMTGSVLTMDGGYPTATIQRGGQAVEPRL